MGKDGIQFDERMCGVPTRGAKPPVRKIENISGGAGVGGLGISQQRSQEEGDRTMNIFTAIAENTSQPAPKSLEQMRNHDKTGSLGTREQVTSHRAWGHSGDEEPSKHLIILRGKTN